MKKKHAMLLPPKRKGVPTAPDETKESQRSIETTIRSERRKTKKKKGERKKGQQTKHRVGRNAGFTKSRGG